jgi:hypothetical protein
MDLARPPRAAGGGANELYLPCWSGARSGRSSRQNSRSRQPAEVPMAALAWIRCAPIPLLEFVVGQVGCEVDASWQAPVLQLHAATPYERSERPEGSERPERPEWPDCTWRAARCGVGSSVCATATSVRRLVQGAFVRVPTGTTHRGAPDIRLRWHGAQCPPQHCVAGWQQRTWEQAMYPRGFSQGIHGLPLDNTRTHALLYQAGETATRAGQTRSPHTPPNGCLVLRAPGPAGPAGDRSAAGCHRSVPRRSSAGGRAA